MAVLDVDDFRLAVAFVDDLCVDVGFLVDVVEVLGTDLLWRFCECWNGAWMPASTLRFCERSGNTG